VPWSLKHYQQSGQNHSLTFSCYHRQPKLGTAATRNLFVRTLETVRQHYGLLVYGFVVMPEHVHLLVSEPETGQLAQALQSLKQSVARKLALRATEPFWQARYYDFNMWRERKFSEKLRYISSQSRDAGTGGSAGGLDVVELPPLSDRRVVRRGNRIAVDGTGGRTSWTFSNRAGRRENPRPSGA
jgi:putative transposase